MILKQKNEMHFFQFEIFSKFSFEINHFISTRKGGVSKFPFDSLNLGLGVEDEKTCVLENRKRLSAAVEIPLENFVIPNQVHSNNVLEINELHRGKGVWQREESIRCTDSFVTNIPEICLTAFAADCVSLLFFDFEKKVIATAHAGWRGTVNKISHSTIEEMVTKYGCKPENILVGIGPSIGPCCYEIGQDVEFEVKKNFTNFDELLTENFVTKKKHFNLWKANFASLLEKGILEKNIETAEMCTLCRKDLFFSSRSNEGKTGRILAGIMLRK